MVTDAVQGVAHLPGGQRIITCSTDGSLRLWDLQSGAQIGEDWRDEGIEAGVWTMALSPNSKTVASGSRDGTVMLWDVETGKIIAKWTRHTQVVRSVCWSPDGERVVSGSNDGTARVWDGESGEPVQGLNPIKTGHQLVWAVSYSPAATMIATGGFNKTIQIWDAKTGKLLSTIDIGPAWEAWSFAWTSDEKKLISGMAVHLSTPSHCLPIRIFDTATWQQIAVLEGHTDSGCAITLFRNDRLLASTSSDATARLWNLDTNLPVGPPVKVELEDDNKFSANLAGAAFSADGKLLTICADKNMYEWDVHAILHEAGLEDLLSISNAPKGKKSLLNADATRRPTPRRLQPGFFDGAPNRARSSAMGLHPHPHHHLASSSGSGPRAFLSRLPSLFRRSQPNVDEATELQQRPRQSTSSHHSPPVVEVAPVRDKQALYVAPRRKTASNTARRMKNPKWLARVVLFLCCVSPAPDDGHRAT